MSYESLNYKSYTVGQYTFPLWANVTGWMIAASSMVAVPLVAIWQLVKIRGHVKQVYIVYLYDVSFFGFKVRLMTWTVNKPLTCLAAWLSDVGLWLKDFLCPAPDPRLPLCG